MSQRRRPRFSPELLEKIKKSVNIVELVGEHVVLRKSGSNYSGLCPFHGERTPSFSVSESKQLYHCYGCKAGGDLVQFVKEIHGLSFPEAIAELAERGGVPLPSDVFQGEGNRDPAAAARMAQARERKNLAYKLNRFVTAYFQNSLASGQNQPALSYLQGRGLSDELRKSFYVGVAQNSWDALARHLLAKKAPMDLAQELGWIRKSTKPGQSVPFFDLFRNRIVFPIVDLRGKVIAMGGRLLPGGDDSQPKYINSPESFVFQKSKSVFGLFQASKHIREADELILVEGYFDVMALVKAGFPNAVATCGTAMTVEHLRIFRRLASKITVLFDGDRAGLAAMDRAMEIGLDQGITVRGALLPNGQDPDEVLSDGGAAALQGILEDAKPLLDLRIDQELKGAFESPEAKTAALKQVGAWLGRFQDRVGRDVRADLVAQRLGVGMPMVQRAIQSLSPERPPQQEQQVPAPVMEEVRPVEAESLGEADRILLNALVRKRHFDDVLDKWRGKMPPEAILADLFDHSGLRNWIRQLEMASELEKLGSQANFGNLAAWSAELREVLSEAWMQVDQSPDSSEVERLDVLLRRGLGRIWARFSQRIKGELARAEGAQDSAMQAKLMKEYLDVQRRMKEFNNFYE